MIGRRERHPTCLEDAKLKGWLYTGALFALMGCSAGGSGAGGGQGGTSQGGSAQGGFGGLLDGGSNGGSGGLASDAACESVSQTAENKLQPADIIFVVDNSGSMTEEAGFVQSAINTFANGIASAGIDYHVILISADSNDSNGICAPAPLGSGQCPADSLAPNYKHINREVGSSNALQIVLEEFEKYKPMLRPGASKHVVAISDDNPATTAQAFDASFAPLLSAADPLYTGYTFHGIYGFTKPAENQCRLNANSDPCCVSGDPWVLTVNIGTVYRDLADMTSGEEGNLCEQEQGFVAVFTRVSQAVAVNSKLACEWTIPSAPEGEMFDKDRVNMQYFAPNSGNGEPFGRVGSATECANVVDGWYYDNAASPTKIFVCPQTCTRIQGAGEQARIDILFGCASEPAVPR
ncbi:MAG: VWA domain-containing protein [Polyangiaceae bacterium]|nr:VWA domain-containing protein [Polyangiaceae bacterium]MCB9608420.1 VWA domain-containing protein [Polyangiaceae bacterium]